MGQTPVMMSLKFNENYSSLIKRQWQMFMILIHQNHEFNNNLF